MKDSSDDGKLELKRKLKEKTTRRTAKGENGEGLMSEGLTPP